MASILLRNPKKEILKYILKLQFEAKLSKGVSQYSMEQTIYKIISEHKELTKQPSLSCK